MIVNTLTDCQTCEQTIIGHPQCRACLIFVGLGHYDVRLEDGLCEMCRMREVLHFPREDILKRRERRAEALAIYETRGLGAVRARFRIAKRTAARMVEYAKRERATA